MRNINNVMYLHGIMVSWSSRLETGIKEIDDQHKDLVRKVDELLNATNSFHQKENIAQMLEYLARYTVEHFQTEEKHMIASNYPKYKEHKAIHDEFVAKVGNLIKDYKERGSDVDIAVTVNGEVYNWLIQHIMRKDKELADFLKKVNPKISTTPRRRFFLRKFA